MAEQEDRQRGSGKNFSSKVAGTIEKASVIRYLIEQHRAPSCPTLILELGTGMHFLANAYPSLVGAHQRM